MFRKILLMLGLLVFNISFTTGCSLYVHLIYKNFFFYRWEEFGVSVCLLILLSSLKWLIRCLLIYISFLIWQTLFGNICLHFVTILDLATGDLFIISLTFVAFYWTGELQWQPVLSNVNQVWDQICKLISEKLSQVSYFIGIKSFNYSTIYS